MKSPRTMDTLNTIISFCCSVISSWHPMHLLDSLPSSSDDKLQSPFLDFTCLCSLLLLSFFSFSCFLFHFSFLNLLLLLMFSSLVKTAASCLLLFSQRLQPLRWVRDLYCLTSSQKLFFWCSRRLYSNLSTGQDTGTLIATALVPNTEVMPSSKVHLKVSHRAGFGKSHLDYSL